MTNLTQRLEKLPSEKRELVNLLLEKKRKERASSQVPTIPKRQHTEPPLLSFAQQRLWFLAQLQPGNPYYNISPARRLIGPLNTAVLEQSLNEVVKRHESLRTTIAVVDGQPVQVVAPTLNLILPVVDLENILHPQREKLMWQLITEQARHPFDLAQGPLLHPILIRVAEKEHIMLLTMHHIISDGWSGSVLIREMITLYEAFSAGHASPLPELPVQYRDFAVWQRQWLQGEVLDTHLAYWKQQLADASRLQLPKDRPQPTQLVYQGRSHKFLLPAPLAEALKILSQQERVTLFMTLLSAFKILLSRYTGQEDISVGSPIANRNQPEIEGLIGFFVNTLVMRTNLSGNPSFQELLARVRQVCLGAYAHQDLPFEKLVEELQPERDSGRSPLFQVMFVLENASASSTELPGLTATPLKVNNETAKFDLSLYITETATGLNGAFEYNTALFSARMIERMAGHFQRLLAGIVAQLKQPISTLPFLTAVERQQVLQTWNETTTDYPRHKCLHDLYTDQAQQTPDKIALVFAGEQLTYRELDRRSNQLACYLCSLGVNLESPVAIHMERSLEMVVAMLGILKAGGTYVPIDPTYPYERLAFILTDTQAKILLTQERLKTDLVNNQTQVVYLDTAWALISRYEVANRPHNTATAENLAYVMYTSGSTGKPKGVSIPHKGIMRLVKNSNYASLTADDNFLQLAPISFDASTLEIWGALINGARLIIMPTVAPSLAEVGRVLQQHHITTLWLTSALFQQMVDHYLENLQSVSQLLAGGDVLPVSHVEKVLQALENTTLINGYGPTENTTFTCCHPLTATDQLDTTVPIGRPIANTQIYVLDHHLQPVPVGVPGELYAAGDGLARGYLNQPSLTAVSFIPNPFSPKLGSRLYKTGDLVRYQPNGNLEFLGRFDNQVKIRGFRVELGEVETTLGQHPALKETVVLAREDQSGHKNLIAYIVPQTDQELPSDKLRRFLKEKLPEHMVPSAFIMCDALPITPNGKVDRRALSTYETDTSEWQQSTFVPPRTPIEEVLATAWANFLEVERVSIHDNFFELGGHSLLLTQFATWLHKTLQVELSLQDIFEAPTVAEVAQAVLSHEAKPGQTEKIIRILQQLDSLSTEEAGTILQEKKLAKDRR